MPSNVPINFAFSLAFGLLAGNCNVVRLPNKKFVQSEILIKAIERTLKQKKFFEIKKLITFIRYKKNDNISSIISKNVNARVIWGGDETIQNFKKLETNPRCVDLCFSDRQSISLIDLKKLFKLNKEKLNNFLSKFYNDTYTMDQLGCSSPTTVFWLNHEKSKINIFWSELNKLIKKNYDFDYSISNKKFTELNNEIIKFEKNEKIIFENFNKLRINSKNSNYKNFNLHYGSFKEINLKNLNSLKNYINLKCQTLTYFGVDKDKILKLIEKNNIIGIDRIVPVGRAFDLGIYWDGYDLISSLSRVVSN